MRSFAMIVSLSVALGVTSAARADDTIRRPGEHPDYTVEIEPQGVVATAPLFDSAGIGAGLRLSVPVVKNGFIENLNDSVAVTFGADVVHYDSCVGRACGADYLMFPIAMQWNFFVADRLSAFGEPGIYVYHGFFDDFCPNGRVGCTTQAHTGVGPNLAIGGRYHVTDKFALTLRVGYPTFTFGASFM